MDFFKAFALVQVVEVCSGSRAEGREDKQRLGDVCRLLSFAAAGFVVVAANQYGFIGKSAPRYFGHYREVMGRKNHVHRTVIGKMDTGSGGVSFAEGNRFFRFALDDEISTGDKATSQKAFLPVLVDALQAL